MTYYHGSQKEIKNFILPRQSNVINKEKAVFATQEKWLAVFFIAPANDSDIECGFYKGQALIIEQYPNAFDKLKIPGYIYSVDKKYFSSDPRLGMLDHEFISREKVPIKTSKVIKNVYGFLKRQKKLWMIPFEKKMEYIYKARKKSEK